MKAAMSHPLLHAATLAAALCLLSAASAQAEPQAAIIMRGFRDSVPTRDAFLEKISRAAIEKHDCEEQLNLSARGLTSDEATPRFFFLNGECASHLFFVFALETAPGTIFFNDIEWVEAHRRMVFSFGTEPPTEATPGWTSTITDRRFHVTKRPLDVCSHQEIESGRCSCSDAERSVQHQQMVLCKVTSGRAPFCAWITLRREEERRDPCLDALEDHSEESHEVEALPELIIVDGEEFPLPPGE